MNGSVLFNKQLAGSVFGIFAFCALTANAALGPGGGTATASSYEASPPQVVEGADPFLMINLSVELTQQAESFTDGAQTYANGTVCPGRINRNSPSAVMAGGTRDVGICYSSSETYIGYFDPNKCYTYDTSGANTTRLQQATGPLASTDAHYFRPTGATNAAHQCSGGFSGNFMNWATMTALDQFRSAMTGGARLYDTVGANAQTLLVRTHRFDDWGFVRKAISSSSSSITSGGTFTNAPSSVTPFSSTNTLYVVNQWNYVTGQTVTGSSGNRVQFYNSSGTLLGTYNVIVEVCNPTIGLETNCVEYTDGTNTWYKPEGLLQTNALKMRYALTSYSGRTGNAIHGGVLRANAKYIGYYSPTDDGGITVNDYAETNLLGQIVFDPDCVAGRTGCTASITPTYGSIENSGIINYINQFALAAGNYKSNDPAAELFYEGLRYIMGLGATPSFSNGLTTTERDGYPVYGPGTWIDPITNSCQPNFALYVGDQFAHADSCLPGISSPNNSATCSLVGDDPASLNAETLTNTVGSMEGLGGSLGTTTRGRSDGYWIAGLAYWANTNDLRPEVGLPGMQTVKTYMVDTQEYNSSPPMRQANQLWLAAKYGGFEDVNGDNDPNDGVSANRDVANTEWTSETGSNPDPDSYTLASQPTNMVAGLTRVFSDVLENSASASAAAVVANASRGTGAIYQAIYEPRLTDGGTVVTWTGTLRALFVDSQARIREDSDGNGQLTNADYVIRFQKDDVQGFAYAQRYDTSNTLIEDNIAIPDLSPIWDARKKLAEISNGDIDDQRSYTSLASVGRHIFTWVDLDNDTEIDSNEILDFDADTMASFDSSDSGIDLARFLGADSSSGADDAAVETYAENLVNYIRGQDQPGWRNRTIDLDGNGSDETLRLGDIVHSAPLVVGAPFGDYDRVYRDNTYSQFKQRYQNRRQVVYAGANDGMLHAFNAGFFNNSTLTFGVTTSNGEVAHPLGSELWAYVPYNLLPHLQWLKDNEYPHIYYVDGAPQSFDVNIFDDDIDHPGGWGTILVVGFRLGGGDITIDPDSDIDADTSDDRTLRSAYLVFDISNPEVAPTLLAEISHPDLGYTTAAPTVVKRRVANNGSYQNPTANQWYLVFGSGPAGSTATAKRSALEYAISDQTAKAFVFDLNTLSLLDFDGATAGIQALDISGQTTGFVGSMVGKDWNRDFTDEVIYFGTVRGSVSDPTGDLIRMIMPTGYTGTPTFQTLLTDNGTGQPFSAPPYATTDVRGEPWVYAGSGRFLTDVDILSNKQMTYYGIKEPVSSGTVNLSTSVDKDYMVDTTGVRVFTDGTVENDSGGAFTISTPSVSATVATFQDLARTIQSTSGWYFDLDPAAARFVDRTLSTRSSLIFVDYVASEDSCEPAGYSRLYAINMLTGTGSPYAPLGPTNDPTTPVNISADLGTGQYFLSGIHIGEDGSVTVFTTGSYADLVGEGLGGASYDGRRMSWREIPLD